MDDQSTAVLEGEDKIVGSQQPAISSQNQPAISNRQSEEFAGNQQSKSAGNQQPAVGGIFDFRLSIVDLIANRKSQIANPFDFTDC